MGNQCFSFQIIRIEPVNGHGIGTSSSGSSVMPISIECGLTREASGSICWRMYILEFLPDWTINLVVRCNNKHLNHLTSHK